MTNSKTGKEEDTPLTDDAAGWFMCFVVVLVLLLVFAVEMWETRVALDDVSREVAVLGADLLARDPRGDDLVADGVLLGDYRRLYGAVVAARVAARMDDHVYLNISSGDRP